MVAQQSVTKQQIIEAMQALPEDTGLDEAFELLEHMELLQAVAEGEAQLDAGLGIPHEEVKRQIASWLQ